MSILIFSPNSTKSHNALLKGIFLEKISSCKLGSHILIYYNFLNIKLFFQNLAISTANRNNCCIIIANDPDADRLALAEKVPSNNGEDTGHWRVFNGNETGALLAWWALENFKKKNPSFDGKKMNSVIIIISMIKCVCITIATIW